MKRILTLPSDSADQNSSFLVTWMRDAGTVRETSMVTAVPVAMHNPNVPTMPSPTMASATMHTRMQTEIAAMGPEVCFTASDRALSLSMPDIIHLR